MLTSRDLFLVESQANNAAHVAKQRAEEAEHIAKVARAAHKAAQPKPKPTPPRETEAEDVKGAVIIQGNDEDPNGYGVPKIFMPRSDYEEFRVFFSYNMNLDYRRDEPTMEKLRDKFWELYNSKKWPTDEKLDFRYKNIGEMITIPLKKRSRDKEEKEEAPPAKVAKTVTFNFDRQSFEREFFTNCGGTTGRGSVVKPIDASGQVLVQCFGEPTEDSYRFLIPQADFDTHYRSILVEGGSDRMKAFLVSDIVCEYQEVELTDYLCPPPSAVVNVDCFPDSFSSSEEEDEE